jgi:hypothetical protein
MSRWGRGSTGQHAHDGEQVCILVREERFGVGEKRRVVFKFGAGTGPGPAIVTRLPSSATTSCPSPTPAMAAEALELLIIAYGSHDTDTLEDERYGADQRRLEIALRPKLPRAGMNPQEISEWANLWSTLQYQSIKHRCVAYWTSLSGTQTIAMLHSQKWCCEFCSTSLAGPCLSPPADNEMRAVRQTRAHERDDRDVMGPSHPSKDQHLRAHARLPVPRRLPPHRLRRASRSTSSATRAPGPAPPSSARSCSKSRCRRAARRSARCLPRSRTRRSGRRWPRARGARRRRRRRR